MAFEVTRWPRVAGRAVSRNPHQRPAPRNCAGAMDFARTTPGCPLSIRLPFMLALLAMPASVVSQPSGTGDGKVRIVCQAWHEGHHRFLDRVLVLDQLSTSATGPESAQLTTIDAATLIAADHQVSETDRFPFRMSIYDGVSLISNLPELLDRDSDRGVEVSRQDDADSDSDHAARHNNHVRDVSLSMGTTDEEILAALRRGETSVDSRGRRMDYTGTGSRIGGRFLFQSTWSHQTEKNMNVFLKSARGFLDTRLGPPESPEDGPYRCQEPILISGLIASRASCMEEGPEHTELPVLASDRMLVRGLQRGLARQGTDPGPIDGIIGPRTTSALLAWRAARGRDAGESLARDALCSLLHGQPRP